MKRIVFDELKAHFKDVEEDLGVPFARRRYCFKRMMGLIDHFMTATKDQWEEDHPVKGSFGDYSRQREEDDRKREQDRLKDRIDWLEEKVSDLITLKTSDNSLHLSCQKCKLFDVVFKKHARDWKCPRCEVKNG